MSLKNRESEDVQPAGDGAVPETPDPAVDADSLDHAAPFAEAFQEELEAIGKGRAVRQCDAATTDDLVALTFSGGGIRSATFNLGVLQGLANFVPQGGRSRGMLRMLDYLSTVSGGGYIGSWFSAWVHRADPDAGASAGEPAGETGIARVEEALVERTDSNHEATPIQWLRRYSNYLSPRLGLLSGDSWTLIAIYIRNLVLSLSVLLPFVFALVLLPRIFLSVLVSKAFWEAPLVFGFGGLLLFVAFWATTRELFAVEERDGLRWPRDTGKSVLRMNYLMVSFFVCAISICWVFGVRPGHDDTRLVAWAKQSRFSDGPIAKGITKNEVPDDGEVSATSVRYWFPFALVVGVAHVVPYAWYWFGVWRRSSGSDRLARGYHYLWWVGGALASGALGGGLLHYVLTHTFWRWGDHLERVAVFGPGMIFGIFLIGVIAEIGLICRRASSQAREWWATLGAWMLIWGLVWTGVAALTLYWKPFALWCGDWITALGGIGWVLSVVAGALTARSERNTNQKPSAVKGIVLSVAPVIAICGLVVAVSMLSCYLVPTPPAVTVSDDVSSQPQPELQAYWADMKRTKTSTLVLWCVGGLLVSSVISRVVDVNTMSIHNLYANRLVRCYLGASNDVRRANPITGFDPADEVSMHRLRGSSGPLHIVNTAINLVGGRELAWQERMANSFVLSPFYCGFHPSVESENSDESYRPVVMPSAAGETPELGYGDDLQLGTAVAISGAAASPNMGYHSTPTLAVLMTILNVRLGWWLGNPKTRPRPLWQKILSKCFLMGQKPPWRTRSPKFGLWYLLSELFSQTNDEQRYVYLSDGGHFENLGVYEMIRRRCRFIIACDAEADGDYQFHALASLIRKCRTDFGTEIKIDVSGIHPQPVPDSAHKLDIKGFSRRSFALGVVRYPEQMDGSTGGNSTGLIIYLKSSLPREVPVDVKQYAHTHPAFPHQPTLDQFFDESQFESYRQLGQTIAENAMRAIFADVAAAQRRAAAEAAAAEAAAAEAAADGAAADGAEAVGAEAAGAEAAATECEVAELVGTGDGNPHVLSHDDRVEIRRLLHEFVGLRGKYYD